MMCNNYFNFDCIFVQAKQGVYWKQLQNDAFESLLEAGLPFLLRWSMDDSTSAVISAALEGMKFMLVSPGEEVSEGCVLCVCVLSC